MIKLPKNNFVLLETNKADAGSKKSYLFRDPVKIVSCRDLKEADKALETVDEYVKKGFYAAGFVSYEAGYAFEKDFERAPQDKRVPLVWFGIFKRPLSAAKLVPTGGSGKYKVTGLRPDVGFRRYSKNVQTIKRLIRRGDTYQVNYTFRYNFGFHGSAAGLYGALREKQKTSYSAFIRAAGLSILSLSPELFFRKEGRRLETKPMKGTMNRGRNADEDREKAAALKESSKDRSENIMIVDLLRNDLSRVCEEGSVRAERLFEVEKYETLFQMVSSVKGRLNKGVSCAGIFRNMFPSGSVTGAPKIRTMRIIQNLEKGARGVYTGAIGYISPGGRSVFNVAIRTLCIDEKAGRGVMGAGSGIVMDSAAADEYEECLLKAKFLSGEKEEFKMIESLLFREKTGFFLLDLHIGRLKGSAAYFGFPLNVNNVLKRLYGAVENLRGQNDYKVRILLDAKGKAEVEAAPLAQIASSKAVFSKKRTSSKDVFLFHKTTNRKLYGAELKKYSRKGFADVLFTNERGEVTEGARTNIFILKNGRLFTPPVKCGLLPGVYRRYLMEKDAANVSEKVLHKKDIYSAEKVYLANSVRGMAEVSVER